MKILIRICMLVILAYSAFQASIAQLISDPANTSSSFAEKGLFETDEIFQITLSGNVRDLLRDRTGKAKDHSLVLSYRNKDSEEINMPVKLKTRGHFRRMSENCIYPPLLIQFPQKGPHLNSVFREQKKLKLVMPCKLDEYVIREWLVYKIYNLITPRSFRARLVKVVLSDEKKKKPDGPFFGILLEEETQMAERNGAVAVEEKLDPRQTQEKPFLSMAVFEYLIGNTDWSVQYLQNIKLLKTDSNSAPVTVPYDFDHAGIVNTSYAYPAEELKMKSVRERRYRGYCCEDLKVFEDIIAKYNDLKSKIYKIYTDCVLLDERYIKSTTRYLDEFYAKINDPKTWQKEFAYPCDKSGTGNIIIKGLNKDE
jgi:hypothetical protein